MKNLTIRSSLFFVVALGAFFLTSCTTARVSQVADLSVNSEQDLRRDISMEEVEGVLGDPYYRLTRVDGRGLLEVRSYLSFESKRSYKLSFWNGRLKGMFWTDGDTNFDELRSEVNSQLSYGQFQAEVKALSGLPDHALTNKDGRVEMWWYSLTKETAYLIVFEDGRLAGVSKASAYDIREYLEIYKKVVLNSNTE